MARPPATPARFAAPSTTPARPYTNRRPEHHRINPQLHTELWTSWASLLRSYTAAHGLNSTHHAVVEVGAAEIILRVDTRWLCFTHTTLTSSRQPDQPEPFTLEEDGTVTLGKQREEMDITAERLAREIMSA